jgi:DedD protein
MSLFSFFRKNKQESASDDSAFYSRAEEEPAGRRRRKPAKSGRTARGEEPADPILPEKKRARRRLIGAVALVLAAVIGLPMVFDPEPKPVPDDIAIQIPNKDQPMPPAARPETPRATAASQVPASAALDPKEEVVASTVAQPETKPAAAAATPPAAKPEAERPPEQPKTEPPHAAKSDAKPAAAIETADTARARALLEGKPDPKASDRKSSKFVIQVAALATKEKVDELQDKLKDAGIKSYTQKVATASGDRIRIRVGPFASREEAERMRARIVKLGLNGSLIPA